MSSSEIVHADATALPFPDETFGVIIADPPYIGRARGKRNMRARDVGYIVYKNDDWWGEAWRVLKPSGSLYVFCAVRELGRWLGQPAPFHDVICWYAPNAASVAAYWRRGIVGRAPAWRPIIHWVKPPGKLEAWQWGERTTVPPKERSDAVGGRIENHPGWVAPNFYATSAIQSTMRESEPWPNQLPVKLIRWLLQPHKGPVLDLFAGTGTTRVAAENLGLDVVSVDLSPEAIAINRRRPAQTPLAVAE